MKIILKKEFDGRTYVAFCENVPGVYVQATSKEQLNQRVSKALALLKHYCEQRNQPFPIGEDKPLFDIRIRFNSLSTEQLVDFFHKRNYHIEFEDADSVLLMNSFFPFNRVHLPKTNHISPIIVRRIFGSQNAIYVGGHGNLKLHRSAP
ncbi:MAG: hypothetical protein GXO77_05095 [Calditrichaeota bacterium]|nr:hypothetical protein [Calditrichota bacterium]